MICNGPTYHLIDNFYIKPMNELSDHSKIVSVFKEACPKLISEDKDNYNWQTRGTLYLWDKNSKQKFNDNLESYVNEINDIS